MLLKLTDGKDAADHITGHLSLDGRRVLHFGDLHVAEMQEENFGHWRSARPLSFASLLAAALNGLLSQSRTHPAFTQEKRKECRDSSSFFFSQTAQERISVPSLCPPCILSFPRPIPRPPAPARPLDPRRSPAIDPRPPAYNYYSTRFLASGESTNRAAWLVGPPSTHGRESEGRKLLT